MFRGAIAAIVRQWLENVRPGYSQRVDRDSSAPRRILGRDAIDRVDPWDVSIQGAEFYGDAD